MINQNNQCKCYKKKNHDKVSCSCCAIKHATYRIHGDPNYNPFSLWGSEVKGYKVTGASTKNYLTKHPTEDSDWSKRFDVEFPQCYCKNNLPPHFEDSKVNRHWIKSFISNTLTEQKKKIVEKLEGKTKKVRHEGGTDISKILKEGAEHYGYNAALSDAIKAIEEI